MVRLTSIDSSKKEGVVDLFLGELPSQATTCDDGFNLFYFENVPANWEDLLGDLLLLHSTDDMPLS